MKGRAGIRAIYNPRLCTCQLHKRVRECSEGQAGREAVLGKKLEVKSNWNKAARWKEGPSLLTRGGWKKSAKNQ